MGAVQKGDEDRNEGANEVKGKADGGSCFASDLVVRVQCATQIWHHGHRHGRGHGRGTVDGGGGDGDSVVGAVFVVRKIAHVDVDVDVDSMMSQPTSIISDGEAEKPQIATETGIYQIY